MRVIRINCFRGRRSAICFPEHKIFYERKRAQNSQILSNRICAFVELSIKVKFQINIHLLI